MSFVLYLYRRFLPVFLSSLFFFCLVLILVDLLMNLWSFISQEVPPAQILKVMVLYIPKTMSFSLPLSILFAVSYTLSDLYAKNELTAIFAAGVSLFRFTFPLLVLSLALSFGLFFFEDKVVVPTYAKKTELQAQLLNQQQSLNNDRIVIIADQGRVVYNADYYNDAEQRLVGLLVVFRDQQKNLERIVRSNSARWREGYWECSEATEYVAEGNQLHSQPVSQATMLTMVEPPETFRNNTVDVETVSVQEAKAYIQRLSRAGFSVSEATSQYYKKFSFPLVVFIVVFLSIGLSGKTKKNVLLISLVLCIMAAVLFYVTQMVTMLLAQFGYLSPFLGAWFPVILFIFISIILLRFART